MKFFAGEVVMVAGASTSIIIINFSWAHTQTHTHTHTQTGAKHLEPHHTHSKNPASHSHTGAKHLEPHHSQQNPRFSFTYRSFIRSLDNIRAVRPSFNMGLCSAKTFASIMGDTIDDDDAFEAHVKSMFGEIDKDGSGEIDSSELNKLVTKINGKEMADEALEEAMGQMDKDGEGTISWVEFKKWFFDDDEAEVDNSDKLVTDEATRGYGSYKGTHAQDQLDKEAAAQNNANAAQASLDGPATASNKEEGETKAADEDVEEAAWVMPEVH